MDIVIVTTGTKHEEEFWQRHLYLLQGTLLKSSTRVVVTHEDWKEGAGNGLGTLYAFRKGLDKAKNLYGIDLLSEQNQGAAITVYHTAGKGMRLYPLAGSEGNNKSAVKLPSSLDRGTTLTILDAVIKQTATLTPWLKGRLAVFWGDQIFIPSIPYLPEPKHHIEILAKIRPLPTLQEWNRLSLTQYGLVARRASGEAQLVDKCDFPSFQKFLQEKKVDVEGGFGVSLGCFTLSYPVTVALLDFFKPELDKKNGRMDSDPCFWMPLTLDRETYVEIMRNKSWSKLDAEQHYGRMQEFKEHFCKQQGTLNFFGTADVGANSYWWDYGTLDNYFKNNMKLVSIDAEAEAMRTFFNVRLNSDSSCLVNCDIGGGSVKNSVLIGVQADHLEVNDCLIIHSKFKKLTTHHSLLYNVQEEELFLQERGSVRADAYVEGHHLKFYTTLGRDSKADWNVHLPGNPFSYEELYLENSLAKKN